MRYRCWHDIVESMLSALLKGDRGITELCLMARVPVDRGKRIVSHLASYGLLVEYVVGGKTYYRITERGYEWLGVYQYLKSLLPSPKSS